MKTNTEIKNITHDDLVSLLSAATYGNSNIRIEMLNEHNFSHLFNSDYCIEDMWATVLLNGGALKVVDILGEWNDTKDDVYNEYAYKDDETGCVAYPIILQDIQKGLEKCLDERVICYCGEESYLRTAAINLIEDNGELDVAQAYDLMQAIMFGEIVYG